MGFKFGGVQFEVGIVTVQIDQVDTDKMTTVIRISMPMANGVTTLKFYSGIAWRGQRSMSVDLQFQQNEPPEEKDENEDYNEGEHEDE